MTAVRRLLRTRTGLGLLLVAVGAAALLESQVEARWPGAGAYALGHRVAQAIHELEGGLSFAGGEAVPRWAVAAHTVAYFLLLPGLVLAAVLAWARRGDPRAFRVLVFGIAIIYALALPFHLLLPVPERWAFPGAGAILLSDRLSEEWIGAFRTWSALDNGFPSLHAALATLVAVIAYWIRSPWRHVLLCAALMAGTAAFVLGISWLPDLVMGLAVAGLAFALAVRWGRAWYPAEWPAPRPPPQRPAPADLPSAAGAPAPRWSDTAFPFLRPARQRRVFISYRREGSSDLARVVQMELGRRGYPCFLDVDDLGAERFDARLLAEIEAAPNFVLVLAPGSLDRCREADDWLHREIVHALRHARRIVPVVAEGFQFPPPEDLPAELRGLARLNAVVYSHEYFGACFDRLEDFLRAPPPAAG